MSATAVQNLLQRQATELAADACTEAWDALAKSSDGTLSVSFSFKLTKCDECIASAPAASFSIRTKIEGKEDSEPTDVNQGKLFTADATKAA
jgi:hypothetical protein